MKRYQNLLTVQWFVAQRTGSEEEQEEQEEQNDDVKERDAADDVDVDVVVVVDDDDDSLWRNGDKDADVKYYNEDEDDNHDEGCYGQDGSEGLDVYRLTAHNGSQAGEEPKKNLRRVEEQRKKTWTQLAAAGIGPRPF